MFCYPKFLMAGDVGQMEHMKLQEDKYRPGIMQLKNLKHQRVMTGFKLTSKNSTKSYQMYNNFYQVYKRRIIPNFLNTYASKIYQ
jgi:hypothetical protein